MDGLMRMMLKVELGPARKFCRVTALRWEGTVETRARRRYYVLIRKRSVRTSRSPSIYLLFCYNDIDCV